ncbi:MAG: TIGR00296 family protein [Deltaproteobacteria bacterium]|nr:MAG: TIGR00296 family protein [Deltaproteobacteria bacterium]
MKKALLSCFILIVMVCLSNGSEAEISDPGIREPAVSGQFYPADSSKLTSALNYYLEDAVKPSGERPVAIISPHAGYIYSGQIAADAFRQAADHKYDLVVLLGTNHTTPGFAGVSIYPKGGYRTPLGVAKTDEDIAGRLIALDKDFTFKESVHTREHSVEVQVPFVQMLFPDAKIVTAVVGVPDLDMCSRFGKALANILKGRRALIVASSDLSHYPDYDDAVKADRNTLEAILSLDPMTLHTAIRKQEKRRIRKLSTSACGEAPILAAMTAAKELGANCGKIVSYANSGDVSVGDRSRVVGYGAVSFTVNADCKDEKSTGKLSPESKSAGLDHFHKKTLLSFARKTIRQFLMSDTVPLTRGFDPALQNNQGAFVTLKKKGQLRGCIGHLAEDLPLCHVVGTMALQAAFNDRRFTPLTLKEFPEIEIEISVLTPSRRVSRAEDILVGRDGVILRKGGRSAVFLPQVAPEQGWNREQMLAHLSRKAGLSSDGWKADDAQFFTFQAIVFSE